MPLIRKDLKIKGNLRKGEYQILDPIGSGGYGEVFSCLELNGNIKRAIKIIPLSNYSDKDKIKFEREVQYLSQVVHENIINILDYDTHRDGSKDIFNFIVMELAESGSLKDKLKKQQTFLEESEYNQLLIGILEGVKAIHEKDILHRDVKSDNILLIKDIPKVSDFGISKYLQDSTRTITYKGFGTDEYKPPEVWEELGVSRATDIYSLGILFFEILTLCYPYETKETGLVKKRTIKNMHLRHPIPLVSDINKDIPLGLAEIIKKMMLKNPKDRYQDTQQIIEDMNSLNVRSGVPDMTSEDELFAIKMAQKLTEKHNLELTKQIQEEEERKQQYRLKELELEEREDARHQFDLLFKELDLSVEKINKHSFDRKIHIQESPNFRTYNMLNKNISIIRLDILNPIVDIKGNGTIFEAAIMMFSGEGGYRESLNLILIKTIDGTYTWEGIQFSGRYQNYKANDRFGINHYQQLNARLPHGGNLNMVRNLSVKEEFKKMLELLCA